jgi:hypothetical protein
VEERSSFQGCIIINTMSNSSLTKNIKSRYEWRRQNHKGMIRYLSGWKKKSSCANPTILWSRFLASSKNSLYSCKVSCNKYRCKKRGPMKWKYKYTIQGLIIMIKDQWYMSCLHITILKHIFLSELNNTRYMLHRDMLTNSFTNCCANIPNPRHQKTRRSEIKF